MTDLWKLELEEGDDKDELQKKVVQIESNGNFNYAIVDKKGDREVYSWGMGENYVLGNREDNNEFVPFKLHPKMFKEQKLQQIACGLNHVVGLTLDDGVTEIPVMDTSRFTVVPSQYVEEAPKEEDINGYSEEQPKADLPAAAEKAQEEMNVDKPEGEQITETNPLPSESHKRDIHMVSNVEADEKSEAEEPHS